MRPISIINGIVLGTFSSVAFGLLVVLLIFLILRGDFPQLDRELGTLAVGALVFTAATGAAIAAFLGHLQDRSWKWYAQFAQALAIGGVVSFFLML